MATYSHAWRAMNSSVPPLSPPLISRALSRISALTASHAMNSVVFGPALVSVDRRASLRPRVMPVVVRGAGVAAMRLLHQVAVDCFLLIRHVPGGERGRLTGTPATPRRGTVRRVLAAEFPNARRFMRGVGPQSLRRSAVS